MTRPMDYNDGYDPVKPIHDPADDEPPPWMPYPETQNDPLWVEKFLAHIQRRVDMTKVCESPIEIDLGAALLAQAEGKYRICPQYKLHRYRYDFAILPKEQLTPLVLVECDGAAFHSTPEQLANDRAKDQAAIKAGTRVIRVTGKEIYHNPDSWAAFILGECRLEERRRADGS